MTTPLPDFTIENFHGIERLHLTGLQRATLLVGKNGAGKTSVLEAIDSWARGMAPSVKVGGEKSAAVVRSFFLRGGGLDGPTLNRLWGELYQQRVDKTATKALQLAFPEVEDVNVIDVGGARIPVVGLAGEPSREPLARLGEGALRIFGLALSLVAAQSGVLLIDEFENGLHHSIQTDIWRFILRTAQTLNVQVFATTHSRDTVQALAEVSKDTGTATVIRLERKGGATSACLVDQTTLGIAMEEGFEIR